MGERDYCQEKGEWEEGVERNGKQKENETK
jgi:hypothetical protein